MRWERRWRRRVPSRTFWAFLFSCVTFSAGEAAADVQKYPVPTEILKSNAERVASDMKGAPGNWKNAPCVFYAVPAISPVKRLPETFPEDGKFLSQLSFIAAQGEFEPASIVVYPFRRVESLELKASDLSSGQNTIPASALDIKIVKVWYQQGSAWYGFYGDPTRRMPTPELLLNDENLIRVDHGTQDNYVRYECPDGSRRDAWMSFRPSAVNYSGQGQANLSLIEDSPALLPASLAPGEFKQFFVTVGVPETAAPGVYNGTITLAADGQEVGRIPVILRVLPFQLPRPATYYDLSKEFYGSIYNENFRLKSPKVLRNLKNHNILNPMLDRASQEQNPKDFALMIERMKAAGLSTKPLFGGGPYASMQVDDPPTPEQQLELDKLRRAAARAVVFSEKDAGHRELYSYGYDEGGPGKIRRERAAWRIVHESGGKTMVSSYPHGRLIFNLDYLIMPGTPRNKKAIVDMRHAANHDSLVAWYADPHSGPENPDYFRRLHGMMTYKADYDAICNYVWDRNNWNDFWVPGESNLRGLMMVYPTKDNVIDTLAWEGIREGLDDIRYATKLKQLATQALKSKDVDVNYVGRKAMSWLSYWDESREDLDAGRLEMINYILRLDSALKGGE